MEAFLISTGLVALAEIGDKTRRLSFMLAARYRRPWPIIWGIFVGSMYVRWDGEAAATPHGQLEFFAEFLAATGVFDRWSSGRWRA